MTAAPWRAARTLEERRADTDTGTGGAPVGRAPEELRGWRAAAGGDAGVGRRLAAAGMTIGELEAILADGRTVGDRPAGDHGADDRPDADPPAWWTALDAVLRDPVRPIADRDDAEDADVARGALRLVAPVVRRAHAAWRGHPEGTPDAARSLADALATELVELARPTVAADLVASAAVGGWPAGDASRAAAALRRLGDPATARGLFAEHPGLARMVEGRARLATTIGTELLDRVAADRPRLRDELFDGGDPGAVSAVSTAGDAHDGGRRVAIVTFASGSRAVLKPRPMAADAAWQALLGDLSARGFAPALRVLRTVEAGPAHGWQECAEAADCGTEDEVERYFRRLGGQLALLHALRATDMHQENLLACGEHPVLIDLETVLHPRLGGPRAAEVDPEISETGVDCLLRVGLLPRRDVAFGVDISGLGRDPAGAVEVDEQAWSGSGADARLERRRVVLQAGENAVRLRGAPVRPHEHVDALARGFADAYDLLVRGRDELLAPGGALAAFSGVPVRVVLRPTKVYADLLRAQSEDLACVDDGLTRERRLAVLWRAGVRRPELAAVAAAERADLWDGDVPKLTTVAGSADLHHHRAGALVGALAPHRAPGPEVVRRLDGRDRDRQLATLRASVLAAGAGRGAGARPGGADAAEPSGTAATGSTADGHRAAARRIARRLGVLALHDAEGRAGWLTVEGRDGTGPLVAAGAGLGRGHAGIVLALRRLTSVAPEASALLEAAERRLDELPGPGPTSSDGGARAEAGDLADPTTRIEDVRRRLMDPEAVVASAPRDVRSPARALALAALLRAADDAGPEVVRGIARTAATPDGLGAPGTATVRDAVSRDRLARTLAEAVRLLPPDDPADPSSRRLELAAARAAAGLDVAVPGPDTFAGGVETPVLDGGLAGIGLARLALSGDPAALLDLAVVAALRDEATAGAGPGGG